jgi:beta-N-acetylhexosaminidase
MSLRLIRRHIGQLITASVPGPAVTPELRSLAAEFDVGALILFKRNVEEAEQVAELSREASGLGREMPVWVSVDQEGGRVARLRRPFTEWPPMATLGRAEDADLSAKFADSLARELLAVGITLDYAPVLDVLSYAKNTVIGDRAISSDSEVVARVGRRIIETLQAAGLAACGKHFPGHGDTVADSHHELPVVEASPERLDAVEYAPFRAAIDARVAFVMVGHLLVPCFDEVNPASLSRAIVDGQLRRRLGFEGVILTDDLDMQAVAKGRTMGQIAVEAVAAGVDGLLICGGDVERQFEAIEALIRALEDGTLPISRVEDAMERQRRAKERFFAPDFRPKALSGRHLRDLVGCADHQAVAEAMAAYL